MRQTTTKNLFVVSISSDLYKLIIIIIMIIIGEKEVFTTM